jgi:hypothetical protein
MRTNLLTSSGRHDFSSFELILQVISLISQNPAIRQSLSAWYLSIHYFHAQKFLVQGFEEIKVFKDARHQRLTPVILAT